MPYRGPAESLPFLETPVSTQAGFIPIFAQLPDLQKDLVLGGGVIDRTAVTADGNGNRLLKAGQILKLNTTTKKFVPVASNDDGTGTQYVMLMHDRDLTLRDAAFEPLMKSWHVIKDSLSMPIPAAILALGSFRYHITGNVQAAY